MRYATVTQRETRLCICTRFVYVSVRLTTIVQRNDDDGVTLGITQRSFPKRETRAAFLCPDCGYYLKD